MKKSLKKKVISHLKGDIGTYKHEAQEDRELIHDLKKGRYVLKKKKKAVKKPSQKKLIKLGRKEEKIRDVMEEYKLGKLHSGSKKGPKVTSRKQAIAIALSEARRKKKKKK